MSDNVELPAEESLIPEEVTDNSVPLSDWVLREIVNLANESHMEMGMTLTTPSGLISGTLISMTSYLDELDKDLGRAMGDASSLRSLFDGVREQLPLMKNYPNNLHLKNAIFFLGGNQRIPGNGGVLWRGKISDVTGYTFGQAIVE
jgi:hypothetical protein